MRLWPAGVGRGLEGVREHTSNPYGCASRTTRIIRNGPLVCCVVYCAWCVCVCMYVGMYVCVCVCVVGGGRGVTLMILGWGCTGGTLKPLVQLEFDQTPKISPYPTFAIFQKLPRSTLSLILSRVTGKSISFCECHVLVSLV